MSGPPVHAQTTQWVRTGTAAQICTIEPTFMSSDVSPVSRSMGATWSSVSPYVTGDSEAVGRTHADECVARMQLCTCPCGGHTSTSECCSMCTGQGAAISMCVYKHDAQHAWRTRALVGRQHVAVANAVVPRKHLEVLQALEARQCLGQTCVHTCARKCSSVFVGDGCLAAEIAYNESDQF